MSELDDLHKLDWVAIPNAPYIMKYVFNDTGYNVMISNLTFLYSEKLIETNVLQRFCKLNPFAQMKLQVILENLRKSLIKCLTEKDELGMKLNSDKLIITLKFPVAAHVLCNYDIEMDLMGAEKVTQYIIGPTVLSALLSQRKHLELQKRILSIESTKSPLSSNISVTSQNAIDPDWLKGQNVSIEIVLDSFLKIQNNFKDLYAENYEAYYALRKEKLKNESSNQSMSPHKKCKLQEKHDDESTNIKFEDGEERISVKEEEAVYSDTTPSEPLKNIIKKKKTFKI